MVSRGPTRVRPTGVLPSLLITSDELRFGIPEGEIWFIPRTAQRPGETLTQFAQRVAASSARITNVAIDTEATQAEK